MMITWLNDGWQLRSEELFIGPEMNVQVSGRAEGWMDVNVPCDVHVPLIENGIIKEPLEQDFYKDCRWVEDKSWWFKKEFDVRQMTGEYGKIDLVFESLDSEADIFLNGVHLGHHRSSFYPFRYNAKDQLVSGKNTLLVRVTSGLEHYSDLDAARLKKYEVWNGRDDDRGSWGDARRIFVRKAQYEYGWDHVPRLATCGIAGNVRLEFSKTLRFGAIHVATTQLSGQSATIAMTTELENFHSYRQQSAFLRFEISYEGKSVITLEKTVLLQSGINSVDMCCDIPDAKLWWPNGMGEQNLYTVEACVRADNQVITAKQMKFGIRTIQLDQSPINDKERFFAIEINGIRTYCKGADWVPADCIYSRVSDEKYEIILKDAANANFNMLRIWGGGIYEKEIFYEMCDQLGIMIWHDFMLSCAMYPDYLDWFRHEVEQEIEYQTKRLRNHPSIVIFCGNNENHWFMNKSWCDENNNPPAFFGGEACYNHIIPTIVQKNCPEIPYWRSSPYGGEDPNSGFEGDQHRWSESFMNKEMAVRISPEECDKTFSKFITEYGYIGPLSMESTLKYHAGESIVVGSSIWLQHTNRFEKEATLPAIRKHYSEKTNLSLEEHLLFAGLFQGTMYSYSLESIRFVENCWGSLFWDYNDSWGEVGWSIIDYYATRKIPYYFVKRAFSNKSLILREKEGTIKVLGVNDTACACNYDISYGYISFDGKNRMLREHHVELEPFSRKVVLEFDKGAEDCTLGCIVVLPKQSEMGILPAILRTNDVKDLCLPDANLAVKWTRLDDEVAEFMVASDVFAHAVHFNLGADIRLSDEYFDLLPGETRTVRLESVPKGFNKASMKPSSVQPRKA